MTTAAPVSGPRHRALVLGGGGVAGAAWQLGMICGLAQRGVDLVAADVVIGTSGGALTAAQITSGTSLNDLLDLGLASRAKGLTQIRRPGALKRMRAGRAMTRARDDQDAGIQVGRLALRAKTISEAQRRLTVASRLTETAWPGQPVVITAVDALTGELALFRRDSDVELIDAVLASSAAPLVWPAATVHGRRYIDGTVRSPANVDLAAGYERVVVLAPVTDFARASSAIPAQVEQLGASTRVVVISPDASSLAASDPASLDPDDRAVAVLGGQSQSASVLDEVSAIWG
jgi:NTE family protein